MNKIDGFFWDDASYFLFGPHGTGKTTWLNAACGDGYRIDFLHAGTRLSLMSNPQRLRMPAEKFMLSLRSGEKISGEWLSKNAPRQMR